MLLLCLLGADLGVKREELLAAGEEILTPPPGATVAARRPVTHLVLRQPRTETSARIWVESLKTSLGPVATVREDRQRYLHFRLPLEPGENSFTILPGDLRFDLNYQQLQADLKPHSIGKEVFLFHEGGDLPEACAACHELAETKTVDPVGLERQPSCVVCHKNVVNEGKWQHSASTNQQCLACHQSSTIPWRVGFPSAEIRDLCLACHTGKKRWFSQESVHGPLYLGGCTLCHDPHADEHRYQLWAEGSVNLCVTCHSDKQALVSRQRRVPNVHGIIFGKGCVACHDPHAAEGAFMLHETTNDLCVGCHPDLAEVQRGHPVSNHPVSGPREIRRPGRKLTCVSCHDPHGSSQKALLIETIKEYRLCRECHPR